MLAKLSSSFKKFSLSIYYLIFATIVIILLASFSLLKGLSDYRLYQENQQRTLEDCAYRIQNSLASLFDSTFQIQTFMGKQIAQHNHLDLNYIINLFRSYKEIKKEASLWHTWPSYQWTNNSLVTLVSTSSGIINPVDLSHRKYLQSSKETPWKLFVSELLIGNPSRERCISAATGVTNNQGKFLGSVLVGINVDQLFQMLNAANKSTKVDFLIMNDKAEIILSSKNYTDKEKVIFNNAIKNKIASLPIIGNSLEQPIQDNQIEYSYLHKVKGYPYYVLTGFDCNIAKQELSVLLVPKILEALGLGTMCFILLAFFKYWFINPIQALSNRAENLLKEKPIVLHRVIKSIEFFYLSRSLIYIKRYLQNNHRMQKELKEANYLLQNKNKELIEKKRLLEKTQVKLLKAINITKESDMAKNKFLKQVGFELKTSIHTILESTKKLTELVEIFPFAKRKFLQKKIETVYQAALELKTYSRTNINLQHVDVKNIMEESLKIHSKVTYNKKINCKLSFEKSSNIIYADKFRLKQSFVGLLHKAIHNTPYGGEIEIQCAHKLLNGENCIQISIEDNGYGSRLPSNHFNLGDPVFECSDAIELEFETIKKLIQLQGGAIDVEFNSNGGQKTKLTLPIDGIKLLKETNNIYRMDAFKINTPIGNSF